MIGTVRKHQQWLWIVIIFVVIISFVVFFSPYSKLGGRDGGGVNFGSINGKPITREQYLAARAEVAIFFRLVHNEWPSDDERLKSMGFNMEQEIYLRIVMAEKMKELGIQPGHDATAKMIASIFGAGEGKGFSMEHYNAFLKDMAERAGLTRDDLERFARNEAGRQQLVALQGIGGKLVPPQEAAYFYRRDNEKVQMDAVFFSLSNYLSKVQTDDTKVEQYFNQNAALYRTPDRVAVSYLAFEATNFMAEADTQLAKMTNLPMIVDQIYFENVRKHGTNFYRDDKGRALTMEEARPKVQEEIRRELAVNQAMEAARALSRELIAFSETNQTQLSPVQIFEETAKSKALEIRETAPFAEQDGPKEFSAPAAFRYMAFRLTDEEPLTTSPIRGENGAYLLALKKKVPSELPPFASLKDSVVEDYKQHEARRMARQAGEAFQAALAKGLEAGKTFQAVCDAEQVTATALPAFSLSTRSLPELKGRIALERLQNASARIATGKPGDFMATEDGGVVLFVRSRIPADEARMNTELADYAKRLGEQRQYAVFNSWIQKQPEKMRLVSPEMLRQQAGKQ